MGVLSLSCVLRRNWASLCHLNDRGTTPEAYSLALRFLLIRYSAISAVPSCAQGGWAYFTAACSTTHLKEVPPTLYKELHSHDQTAPAVPRFSFNRIHTPSTIHPPLCPLIQTPLILQSHPSLSSTYSHDPCTPSSTRSHPYPSITSIHLIHSIFKSHPHPLSHLAPRLSHRIHESITSAYLRSSPSSTQSHPSSTHSYLCSLVDRAHPSHSIIAFIHTPFSPSIT